MPVLSMFFGIIINMYNNAEHNPPHFHAKYEGYEAVFNMNGEIIKRRFSKKTKKASCCMG